jgi:transposase-like protein
VPTRRSRRSQRPETYGTKWPKTVAKIADDQEEPLAFYDFPAEHWIHLRTTNPIESTFSTVKLRTKVTRGAGSPAAALATVLKLVESTQEHCRAITGARVPASSPSPAPAPDSRTASSST